MARDASSWCAIRRLPWLRCAYRRYASRDICPISDHTHRARQRGTIRSVRLLCGDGKRWKTYHTRFRWGTTSLKSGLRMNSSHLVFANMVMYEYRPISTFIAWMDMALSCSRITTLIKHGVPAREKRQWGIVLESPLFSSALKQGTWVPCLTRTVICLA
jgi:hypothetical protein